MNNKNRITAMNDHTPVVVPKMRFPEFQQAGPWEKTRFDEVLSSIARERKKPSESYTGLGLRSHGKGTFLKPLEDPEKNSMEYLYEVKCDDLIVNITFAWEGAVAIASIADDGALVSHRFPTYTFEKGKASPAFFRHIILDKQFVYALGVISPGGAGRNRVLSKNDFLKLEVLLPSPAEQEKIADCLSSADELIAAQARKVNALKAYKNGLVRQLFPLEGETKPRLRFPEFQNSGEWEERKLGTVCEIQRGKFSHRPRNDPRFFGGQYPFIQTGDVVRSGGRAVTGSQSLNEDGLAVSKLFKPTIVLITIAANIGDTGLLQTEGCFTDSVAGLIPKREVIPVFLELVMRGQKDYLNKVATTGAQKNINNEILREVSILLPSIPEQKRIADCLTTLDDLITAQTKSLNALNTQKKGLMQQLLPFPEEVEA